jgi:hypothetical protein
VYVGYRNFQKIYLILRLFLSPFSLDGRERRGELVCFDCGDQLDIIRPDPLAEEENLRGKRTHSCL